MTTINRTREKAKMNPWSICTLVGCFYFPVGIVWAIVLTVKEAKTSIEQNRVILHCGIASAIFSLFMEGYLLLPELFQVNRQPSSFYLPGLFYVLSGVLSLYLLIVYGALSARNRRLRRCLMLVRQEHITSVPQMGEIMGLRSEKVILLLKKLIRMGRLDGAYLREDGQELLFKKSVWAKQRFTCRSCGADLVVDCGRTLICDYCGGALELNFFRPQES